MKIIDIKLTGDNLNLSFSVTPEVARHLIRQLTDAALNVVDEPPVASAESTEVRTAALAKVSSTYRPLARFFAAQLGSPITLSFREIEEKLGQILRPSARKHKAWWANTETHVQASAWLHMGYRTSDIQLEKECITFTRQ